MRREALALEAEGISMERQRELEYFCYQYGQKRREAGALLSPGRGELDGMPRGSGVGDPTGAAAVRREKYLRDVEDIEQAALGAAGDAVMAKCLLGYVVQKEKPPLDFYPCGRRQFYAMRRTFFVILDNRLMRR